MAGMQELVDCMISSWYPRFQKATFKTVLIPLPQPVVDWLVSDGLHLPADSEAFAKQGPLDEYATEDDYQEWSSEDETSGDSSAQAPPSELAQLRQQLAAAIESLGGRVVPKLSWSCPVDAVWMSPSTSLCCSNADEVLLLLRASDRVAHDICRAVQDAAATSGASSSESRTGSSGDVDADTCLPQVHHCLALRRWHDLQPGREFRCFVRGQRLVGASQRDVMQCYPFLREERGKLAAAMQAFHAKHIEGRFPHPTFTYDVYVAASGAVRLLDFNTAGGTTAPLLFTWEELLINGAGAQPAAAADETDRPVEAAASMVEAEAEAEAERGERPPAARECNHHEAEGQVPAADEPLYLGQLRRVEDLSLAGQQQQQQHKAGGLTSSVVAIAAAAEAAAAATPEADQAAAHPVGQPFDLRIVEEAVLMRPHTLAYGVPFDFVDNTEGSALERLLAQLQQKGAGKVWEALGPRQGGGGAAK